MSNSYSEWTEGFSEQDVVPKKGTTTPGAFTAAREAGLVVVHEGVPVRTPKGEAFLRRLKKTQE